MINIDDIIRSINRKMDVMKKHFGEEGYEVNQLKATIGAVFTGASEYVKLVTGVDPENGNFRISRSKKSKQVIADSGFDYALAQAWEKIKQNNWSVKSRKKFYEERLKESNSEPESNSIQIDYPKESKDYQEEVERKENPPSPKIANILADMRNSGMFYSPAYHVFMKAFKILKEKPGRNNEAGKKEKYDRFKAMQNFAEDLRDAEIRGIPLPDYKDYGIAMDDAIALGIIQAPT